MKSYVYVLWSDRLKKRYIGCCSDLDKRINDHNWGRQRFTKSGIPWRLVYSEKFGSFGEARRRENYLKTRSGRRYLDRVINI